MDTKSFYFEVDNQPQSTVNPSASYIDASNNEAALKILARRGLNVTHIEEVIE